MAAARNPQAGANPTVWLQAGGGPHGGKGLGPRARKARLDVAKEAIAALSQHAAIDEQVVYPAVPAQLPDETDTVLEALDEHHAATWLLSKLDGMTPDDERFAAKFIVLAESVRHHLQEERETRCSSSFASPAPNASSTTSETRWQRRRRRPRHSPSPFARRAARQPHRHRRRTAARHGAHRRRDRSAQPPRRRERKLTTQPRTGQHAAHGDSTLDA